MAEEKRDGARPMTTGRRRAALLVAVLLLGGCAARVGTAVTPEQAQPRPVVLVEHGRHTSLVLQTAEGQAQRWVYGDWRWYVDERTGGLRALPTLLWPTRAALGRRELEGPATGTALRPQLRVGVSALHAFEVDGAAVDILLAELNERFEARRDTLQFNERYDLAFVEDPRAYTLWHNSNHVVADWLRRLGIPVRGSPALGNWRVD